MTSHGDGLPLYNEVRDGLRRPAYLDERYRLVGDDGRGVSVECLACSTYGTLVASYDHDNSDPTYTMPDVAYVATITDLLCAIEVHHQRSHVDPTD